MKKLVHRVVSGPDAVTGHYTTRCGLTSAPTAPGYWDRFLGTTGEVAVTCPKCTIHLTPIQKKILRIMYDNVGKWVVFTLRARSFSWRADKDVRFYGRDGIDNELFKLGLITTSLNHNIKLTRAGMQLASKLPPVKDDFR